MFNHTVQLCFEACLEHSKTWLTTLPTYFTIYEVWLLSEWENMWSAVTFSFINIENQLIRTTKTFCHLKKNLLQVKMILETSWEEKLLCGNTFCCKFSFTSNHEYLNEKCSSNLTLGTGHCSLWKLTSSCFRPL